MMLQRGLITTYQTIKMENHKEKSGKDSNTLLYCDDCKYLKPKEHEQNKRKEPHFCIIFEIPVFHSGHHPRILRPKDCHIYKKE